MCPSIDKWIKKLWYPYTMEYYSAMKKKETLAFATTSMVLGDIMLSDISWTKTNTMYFHLPVESKKQHRNSQIQRTN